MALQAFWPGRLGVDTLNVVRTISKLLDHATTLPLVKNGDLICIVKHMILARGPESVPITKVKRHRVRAEDTLGNMEADTVADLGRSHQSEDAMDAPCALINGWSYGYPIML